MPLVAALLKRCPEYEAARATQVLMGASEQRGTRCGTLQHHGSILPRQSRESACRISLSRGRWGKLPNLMKSSTLKSRSGRPLSASAAKLRLLKRLRCTLRYEKRAWATGARLVAGVDEVGRGSLFGCVVAAAVILDPAYRLRGLRDSKLLLPERREVLAERIREHAVAWAVAAVDAARIDQINIYQASRAAMREAVLRLSPAADHLLIDAVKIDCEVPQDAIIH